MVLLTRHNRKILLNGTESLLLELNWLKAFTEQITERSSSLELILTIDDEGTLPALRRLVENVKLFALPFEPRIRTVHNQLITPSDFLDRVYLDWFDLNVMKGAEKDISYHRGRADTLDNKLRMVYRLDIMERAKFDMDAYKSRAAELRTDVPHFKQFH